MLTGSDEEMKTVASSLISKRSTLLAMIFGPLVVAPSCMMGIPSGIGVLLLKDSEKAIPLLGLLASVVIPLLTLVLIIWFYRSAARSLIFDLREKEKDALKQCLAALPQPTYFNAACGIHGGAIAVDPVSKKIALVFGQVQAWGPLKTQLITLEPGELRNWGAEEPALSTLELIGSGHSSSEVIDTHNHNMSQSHRQAIGTGLRLITENLNATEIFLNFDFEVAKSWVALLSKLDAGRLETLTVSTEFPNPKKFTPA